MRVPQGVPDTSEEVEHGRLVLRGQAGGFRREADRSLKRMLPLGLLLLTFHQWGGRGPEPVRDGKEAKAPSPGRGTKMLAVTVMVVIT